MGAFLDTPLTTKETDSGAGNDLSFGVSSMQGWRVSMEDAHVAAVDIPSLPGHSFFGVFDGHAGQDASAASASGLLRRVVDAIPASAKGRPTPRQLVEALTTGFIAFDELLKELPGQGVAGSGTTAITCFVTPTHVVVANCGDSRAVYARGDGEIWGSTDHKPQSETESKRIVDAGGFVAMGRVNGTLAVSRALGDFDFKRRPDLPPAAQQVSAEPTCSVFERHDKDEYLVLCCDGIWDVMTNEETVAMVREKITSGMSPTDTASHILDQCLARNSRDNMTACIIQFPWAAKEHVPGKAGTVAAGGSSGASGADAAAAPTGGAGAAAATAADDDDDEANDVPAMSGGGDGEDEGAASAPGGATGSSGASS